MQVFLQLDGFAWMTDLGPSTHGALIWSAPSKDRMCRAAMGRAPRIEPGGFTLHIGVQPVSLELHHRFIQAQGFQK